MKFQWPRNCIEREYQCKWSIDNILLFLSRENVRDYLEYDFYPEDNHYILFVKKEHNWGNQLRAGNYEVFLEDISPNGTLIRIRYKKIPYRAWPLWDMQGSTPMLVKPMDRFFAIKLDAYPIEG